MRKSASRPSRSPSGSRPHQVTSPAAVSASRSAGLYPSTRADRISDSKFDAGSGAPWRFSIASSSASSPSRGRETPCQLVSNRPKTAGSTGSTSLRNRASDRRRTDWSTSGSHHSRPVPPGLNSPSSSRPEADRAFRIASAVARPSAYRSANSTVVKGPCVLANRRARSCVACGAGATRDSGRPTGSGTPSASRYLPAYSTGITRGWPPILTTIARRARRSSCSASRGSMRARLAISSSVRSPRRKSRSCSPSTDRA